MKKIKTHKSNLINSLLGQASEKEKRNTEKKMLLASKIYEAMKAKGLRKTDLAKKMNQENSVITKWISGTNNFTVETLWDIEEELDIVLIELNQNDKVIKIKKETYPVIINVTAQKNESLNDSKYYGHDIINKMTLIPNTYS